MLPIQLTGTDPEDPQQESSPQADAGPGASTVGQRLRYTRERRGWTQLELTRRCGWGSAARIHNYEKGDRLPRLPEVALLAQVLDISPRWLAWGGDSGTDAPEAMARTEFAQIPYLREPCPSASATSGDAAGGMIPHLTFRRDWLTTQMHLALDRVAGLRVDGQSMEPTLNDGDMVLVNLADKAVRDNRIYVVRVDHSLFIKRLFRIPGGIRVKSDNPVAEAFELSLSRPELWDICGRVVWVGREL
ncbi:MAG: helix-turn-helix transcriptional regulator [Magnetococcus sp. WYHC-3]